MVLTELNLFHCLTIFQSPGAAINYCWSQPNVLHPPMMTLYIMCFHTAEPLVNSCLMSVGKRLDKLQRVGERRDGSCWAGFSLSCMEMLLGNFSNYLTSSFFWSLFILAADFGVSAKNNKTLQRRDSFIGTPYWWVQRYLQIGVSLFFIFWYNIL